MIKKGLLLWVCMVLYLGLQAQSPVVNYVHKYAPIAQELMDEYHVPASLILAVAIHESAAGKSKIARNLKNHFGVKGTNYSKKIRSSYKQYPHVRDSYEHFCQILVKRDFFNSLENKSVAFWVKTIHPSYARSPTWGKQVRAIISKYDLQQYDDATLFNVNVPEEIQDTTVQDTQKVHTIFYSVRKGDTLSGIAKKYHTTVNKIKKKNKLSTSKLKIGRKLKI